jgi:hypothetical protein
MMRAWSARLALMLCGWAVPAFAEGRVTLSLTSPSNAAAVAPGGVVQWTITASVSTGDNLGLALISVDLVQSPDNPQLIDLPPADRPDGMQDFDRPRGLCNPAVEGRSSGYGGTPVGTAGERNLVQIGGAQNTFGGPGSDFGLDFDVDVGIGQAPGGQIIAVGSFPAPAIPGEYTFLLGTGIANTLQAVHAAPDFSPVSHAAVTLNSAAFSFTVCRPADINGDGEVSLAGDGPAFVDLLLGVGTHGDYATCAADADGDGSINGEDVQPFVSALLAPARAAGEEPSGTAEQCHRPASLAEHVE